MTKCSFARVRVSDCCRFGCCYWQRCLRSMSCTLDLLAQQRANLVAACHACVLEPFLSGFLLDFLYLRSVCTFPALHSWHTVMLAKSGVTSMVSTMKHTCVGSWCASAPVCSCPQASISTTVSCYVTYAEAFGNAEPAGGRDAQFAELSSWCT